MVQVNERNEIVSTYYYKERKQQWADDAQQKANAAHEAGDKYWEHKYSVIATQWRKDADRSICGEKPDLPDDLSTEENEVLWGIFECDFHPPYAISKNSDYYNIAKGLEKRDLIVTYEIGMGMIIAITTF